MSEGHVESVRAVYAEWAKGNFRAGGELFDPEIVIEPMSDGRESYRGIEAANKQWREFFAQWSEFRIEAQDLVEIGDTVLVTERQYGKGSSSGIETEMTFFAAWTFRDGLVVRLRWDSDREQALEAAGLG
ncbi:MAG: nuclear transport factor 2 family protein [Vicinamibacteria bacterium]|jgi:ketosteroid isomerase-like protein